MRSVYAAEDTLATYTGPEERTDKTLKVTGPADREIDAPQGIRGQDSLAV